MWFTHLHKKSSFEVIFLVTFFAIVGLQSCRAMSIKDEMMLNEQQQESFNKFKAVALDAQLMVPEYMKKEIVLIKYFRYADLDEKKATELLKDNLKWRLEWGFEKLTEDEINEHYRTYPFSTFTDKLGRGVMYLPFRYWDCTAAIKTKESTKKVTNFIHHIIEEAFVKGVSNITGKKETGLVVLDDLHGTETSKILTDCVGIVKDIVAQIDRRWPLGLQEAYVLNSDPLFTPTINVMKGVLPERVQAIVHVHDENDAIWLPAILKFIPEDKLPAELYIRSRQQGQPQKGGAGPGMAMSGMGMASSMFGQAAPAMGFGGGAPPAGKPEGRSNKKGKNTKKKAKKNDDEEDDDDGGD